MKSMSRACVIIFAMAVAMPVVAATKSGDYRETVSLFKNAGASSAFFDHSYAYAVFPTIGEGALGVGGARGKGRVYVHGVWTGNVTMNQLTVGFQAGGKAFSQIIFFEDKRALDEFTSGSFEFAGDASVTAITAGASASAGTNGIDTAASAGKKDAVTHGSYQKGVVVFEIAKGGLMGQVAVGGQKFSYMPRSKS